jgi:hypothetical protein
MGRIGGNSTVSNKIDGGTFNSIELPPFDGTEDYSAWLQALREAVGKHHDERLAFYEGLRAGYGWVLKTRKWLIGLGVLGVLVTALAALWPLLVSAFPTLDNTKWGVIPAVLALVVYALMAAVALYERMSGGGTGYFRSITSVMAVRDAWTAYQFSDVRLSVEPVPVTGSTEERALVGRRLDDAMTFCKAVDDLSLKEGDDFRSSVEASLEALYREANDRLKESRQSAERDIAAVNAVAALNVEIKGAEAGGIATITIDNQNRTLGLRRVFAIGDLRPGVKILSVEVVAAAKTQSMEKAIELKSGVKECLINGYGFAKIAA